MVIWSRSRNWLLETSEKTGSARNRLPEIWFFLGHPGRLTPGVENFFPVGCVVVVSTHLFLFILCASREGFFGCTCWV